MLLANGISPCNKTYVYLTNKNTQQEIKIEITYELILKWINAKNKYFKGEDKNETFNEIKNELTIKQIKENIFYLNQLIENVEDPVIEFEIRKQIKYELNLLRTMKNKYG